jgi:hypothetical protein
MKAGLSNCIKMQQAKGDDVDYHTNKIEQIKENGVDVEFYLESGRKYYKLICKDGISRSVHCFINKSTGDVLKSASWNAPAEGCPLQSDG